MSYYGWRPYVPVAVRRARAQKNVEKLRKKGLDITPVEIEGRKIARTFWGEAWCDHIESFSDYENRLPRGRTYVRNGSVYHLDIAKGEVNAMVSGSESYNVKIDIETLPRNKWEDVKNRCAGQIGSLLELLQGKLSKNVMSVVTDREQGLFPLPGELSLRCSCPDWAVMCKHVAAVLYGVGARLDKEPELLFLLRGVDHEELIGAEVSVAAAAVRVKESRRRIADDALEDVFGIEMSEDVTPVETPADTPAETSADTKTSRRRKKAAPKSKKASKVAAKRTERSKSKVNMKPTQTQKISAVTRRVPRSAASVRPVTGKAIARLRVKLSTSRGELNKLLGVSVPSIGK